MTAIQWGPWSGALQGNSIGLHAASTSTAMPSCDLNMLQKTMLSMLTDPALSDVCLVVEGKDVHSHKAILAAWSRPFRAMFTLPMLESQHQCRVVIEDAEHEHLMVVLNYLYGGRIGLNDHNVMPVSALANRYEVLPLVAQCESYMKWRLHPSNVCRQLLAAEEHHVPKAASVALEYLAMHFDEVYHDAPGDDFNCLSGEIVLQILQHDGLTADEETVFLAVDGWARAWKLREGIHAPPPNFAGFVGRSPPPAVAAQQSIQSSSDGERSTICGPSSRPIADPTNISGAANPSPSERGLQQALDAKRPSVAGFSDCLSRAGGGARSHVQWGTEVDSSGARASNRGGLAQPPAVTATVTAPMSAAARAAAARARVKEEQETGGKSLASTGGGGVVGGGDMGGGDGDSNSPSCNSSADISRAAPNGQGLSRLSSGTGDVKGDGTTGKVSRGLVLQRRASGSIGDKERPGGWVGGVVGRPASYSHPLLPPAPHAGGAKKQAAVIVAPGRPAATGESAANGGDRVLEAMGSMPPEERAFLDELLMEVRFPLVSTRFLCQVVEKSEAMSGSRVAQRLLHEAYRFQAMTSADAVDVDEHFPGNHRVQFRGHERVLFGEGDGCVGTVSDYSSSLSEVHLVENVKRKNEKYWLPGQPEEAFFSIRLDRVRRLTKVRFQNRYSEEFEVAVRRTTKEEWQVIVPRRVSGGHKDVQEIDLTRKRVNARHVRIALRGRKRSCYNTSCYYTELLGF